MHNALDPPAAKAKDPSSGFWDESDFSHVKAAN